MTQNRKARHDYQIEETFEAGIVLVGTEVKSLRDGKASLSDSYGLVKEEELFLVNAHISPYTHSKYDNHEPTRTRKLLVHKNEIRRLWGKTQQRGYTIIPLKIYFNKVGKAKLELGLAKGKRSYEKTAAQKRKQQKVETARLYKLHRR